MKKSALWQTEKCPMGIGFPFIVHFVNKTASQPYTVFTVYFRAYKLILDKILADITDCVFIEISFFSVFVTIYFQPTLNTYINLIRNWEETHPKKL